MSCFGHILERLSRSLNRCEYAKECKVYKSVTNCDGTYIDKPFCGLHKKFLREKEQKHHV